MTYPDDSIQGMIEPWWEQCKACNTVSRGCLVYAFVPYVDQVPMTITPTGRKHPTEHTSAEVKFAKLEIAKNYKHTPPLPVASMSLFDKELWVASKAKKRPCLVMTDPSLRVDPELTKGMAKTSYDKTIIVAPFYGCDKNGVRAGYSERFLERVRHAEYPQFFYDQLPIPGNTTRESLLRFDQIQPIGFEHNSFELTDFKLSRSAQTVMDDWFHWFLWGGLPNRAEESPEPELKQFWDLMEECLRS